MPRQLQPRSHQGRHYGGAVRYGHDPIDRESGRPKVFNCDIGGLFRFIEADRQRAIGPWIFENMAAIRREYYLDAEPACGLRKGSYLISRCSREE